MNTRAAFTRSVRQLTYLWMGAAAILFAVLVIQTILGKYGSSASEAWGWFLPHIVSSLSLVLGYASYEAWRNSGVRTVPAFTFRITFLSSFLYLCLLAMTVFLQPMSQLTRTDYHEVSSLWL